MYPTLSKHAQRQAQKRGISIEAINLIIDEADFRKWTGDGCQSLQISSKRLANLRVESGMSASLADKVNGVILIRASDDTIVTVMHQIRRFKPRKRRKKKLDVLMAKFGINVAQYNHAQFLKFFSTMLMKQSVTAQ